MPPVRSDRLEVEGDTPDAGRHVDPRQMLAVCLLPAVLAAVALAGPRTYGSNDNFGIIFSAQAGQPITFAGYSTTYVLHLLYSSWPGVPWFGLALYAALLGAATVLSHLVCSLYPGVRARAVGLSIVGCCFLPFTLRPDYNASSILLGGSAVFHLIAAPGGRCRAVRTGLMALLCYGSYSLARFGFFGVVGFTLPFAAAGLCRSRAPGRSSVALAALAVAACIGLDGVAYRATMSAPYRQFLAFDDMRKNLHDSPYLASGMIDPNVLAATGWTQNDYWLFSNWFYLDEGKFNARSVGILRRFEREENPVSPSLGRGIGMLRSLLATDFGLASAAVALAMFWRSRVDALRVLLAFAAVCAGALLMATYWRFPQRIGIPFLALAAIGGIVSPLPLARRSRYLAGLVTMGAVSLVIGLSFGRMGLIGRENVTHKREFQGIVARLAALPSNSVLLVGGSVISLNYSDPLRPLSLPQAQIRTGMSIFSPAFYSGLHQLGIGDASGIIPFLVSSGRGYLVAWEMAAPHIVRFARETYGLDVTLVLVDTLETGPKIYRIEPTAPASNAGR